MPGEEIRTWQARYERNVALTASRATAVRYAKALDSFFSMFPDRKEITDFSRADIEDYRLFKLRDGMSPRTINFNVQIIGQLFRYLIDAEVLAFNPVAKVKRLKEKESDRKSLTLEEQERLYVSVNSYGSLHQRLLVGLLLGTGLRGETLVQLTTDDVDFEASVLRISADKMKAGRNHAIPLRQTELTLLRTLPPGRIFEGFASNAKALSHQFNRILKRAGIRLRGVRTARRTFATTLLRSGVDLRTVQDLLAHRNISTTSRYITPADDATVKAAINKLPTSVLPEVREQADGESLQTNL